ncbi:uncharacterized protein LOC112461779 [Temnothorax curvispinosus]|uniref:Uncharacterized protein LOC112461779 n=1 Tax=Temnothorax curvispinosus TaxID=300111 RepID=A0A6J1QPN3_9HYME|nr:uncharacterized protein LOC112461779 [Temnothorax curvispinosus]
MIFYCGQEHQKQHWKKHKSLCKAIRNVLRNYSMDYGGETTEVWASKKLIFAQLVSSKLGRRLNMDEMQMICFPRECLVCHERNKSLESCQKCAANFCKNHKDGIEHKGICAPLELCLCTDLFSMREGNSSLDLHFYLQHISCTSTFQNMKDFIETFGNIQTDSEMSHNVWAAQHSEYLTCSLTLFYVMRLLEYVPKSNKKLVIHVLCTNVFKEILWTFWEILPRLIGTMMIVIVIIGPELPCKSNLLNNYDNCMSREKKYLTFEFHDVLYENYACSSSFVKPDLVVGFNLYIHKYKLEGRSSKETWAPSIQMLAKQNCPFVLTSATQYSFKKETDIINAILNKEVDHLYSGKNPFASLKPYKTIEMEYVSYLNQYVIIYRSLCS